MKFKQVILFCSFLIVSNAFSQAIVNPIFNKLDLVQLRGVNEKFQKNLQKEALEELLNIYRTKENIYLQEFYNIEFLKANYKKKIATTVNTADEVLNKYFLFRYAWDMEKTIIPHQFKNEIDWKAIPNGDEEWCFMLNRHRYWIDLGKAYYLTGKEKYAKGFVDQVTHWIDNNPLQEDLKKYSWRRIEAGIRIENWIKSFELIKNSKHITPEFLAKFLNSLHQHGTYLNSDLNGFSKTSNWGVLEFHGLFNLSLFLKEFKLANKWQQDALNNLTTCIELQILEDGSQWEQSPMYHNEVFHCYLNVNLLAQRNNIKLPKVIVQKTKEMAYANIKWQKPNYHQPVLGDSDDTDLRDLLTLAAVIFKDPIIKSRAFDKINYETQFIATAPQKDAFNKMESEEPPFLSSYQKSSGDFFMRTSWEEDATYCSLHLKKLGCGHGHDNILHFTIFANNRDYLIDGGRYTYVNNKWREYFKSSRSHNTLGVDNLPNSVYKDSWTNKFEARAEGAFTKSTAIFDYGEAINTAYKRLEDPVILKRRMIYIKPNVWLLFDSFSAKKMHIYSQYFNFPDKNVKILNGGVETSFSDKNIRIQPIKKVEIKLTDEWQSPEYNLKVENKRAEFFKESVGFNSFISLLYFPETSNLKYKKTPVYSRRDVLLPDEDVEAVTLEIDDKKYTILVVHNSSSPANHFYKVNNVLVQGEVVLIENNKDRTRVHLIKE